MSNMKTNQIKLQSLIQESLSEAHDEGSWWIDNGGELQSSGDAEKMKTENWKRMKASADKIEIFTWELRAEDLKIILQGIKKIMGVEAEEDDSDSEVGKDGYSGPRVDLTLTKKNKKFNNVPLGVLEKCLPSRMKNYEKGKDPDLAGPVNEDKSFHHLHKEYRLYTGDDSVTAIFEDNSRLVFEIHFHENHGEDKIKHREKAASKWKTLATKLHRDVQLTEAGNPIAKTWRECFQEALDEPEMKEFIRTEEHHSVFPR